MAQSVSECIFFTSKKTSVWILSTQVKASCVWTRACNLSAVRNGDGVSQACCWPTSLQLQWETLLQRNTVEIDRVGHLIFSSGPCIHRYWHTPVFTQHIPAHTLKGAKTTLVKTKPSKLFRGKGRSFNCDPFIVSHQSKTFLKITPHSEMNFSSDERLCFHNLPGIGSPSSFFTDQAAQLYVLGWIQSGTWAWNVALETCSFWWSLTECHIWIRQPRQRGACSNPINVKIYGLP